MNIDELAHAIRKISDQKEIQDLAAIFTNWKNEKSTVFDLRDRVEKYIGSVWFEKAGIHTTIYSQWETFRDTAINNIGGMTMNERLYSFGLFEIFDRCNTNNERAQIYIKLLAKP